MFLRFLCGLGFLLSAIVHGGEAVKPNIVFILLDDMGPFDPGCYGSKVIQTPHLDALAREGMRFTQAYSGCSVCAPARSTLMTGYDTGRGSVRGNSGGIPLQDADLTLAELLGLVGYVSGGFGKWGLGDLNTSGAPERQGFKRFYGYYHQVHAHRYFPDYLIDTGMKVALPNEGFYAQSKPPGPVAIRREGHPQSLMFSQYPIFEAMKDFIRDHRAGPFFCYAPWSLPHGRYEIPDDDPAWAVYRDKPWTEEEKVHAAFCSIADRYVGETVALLQELGIEERTILFFCSDNGAAFRSDVLGSSGRLRGQKGRLYEGGIRVPFIVRWQGAIAAGTVCDEPVYFPDVLPTVAALAGASSYVPKDIDGRSLLPYLLGQETSTVDRHLYWEWNGQHFFSAYIPKQQAVRFGSWKLVRHDPADPWELYDLEADEAEGNDLAGTHPERVREMAAWIQGHRVAPRPQQEPEKEPGQPWR